MTANRPKGQPLAARINPISAAVAISVGSLTLAGPAQSGTFSEEMIVTATRRAVSTQDVPYNIAAFSGEALEQRQIEDLSQLARWVPGLTVVDQGLRTANTLTVRGLTGSSIDAAEGISNNGGDTVATYLGEVPLYVDLRLVDIERVEVLMGPQGTLYGAGTLGGAIRYIPQKPRTDETTVEVRGKAYDLSQSDSTGYSGDVIFNVPIVSDRLAFRGNIGVSETPGFIDYTNLVQNPGVSNPEPDLTDPADVANNLAVRKDADGGTVLNGRAALLWNIAESGELMFSYNYQKVDWGGKTANNASSFDTGNYVSGYRFLEPNARENQLAAATLIWNFDFAELTSTAAYSNFDEDGQRDQTDLLLNLGYSYPDFPTFAAFTEDLEEETSLVFESRLVSNNEGRLNWIGGVFYRNLSNFQDSYEFTPGLPEYYQMVWYPPNTAPLPTGDLEYHDQLYQRLTEAAVFGEVGYQFFDRWQATLGTRYYDYESTVSEKTDLPLIDDFRPWVSPAPNDDNGVLFKFNTSLDVDDLLPATGIAYLTISEGYRVGGINPLPACTTSGQQNVCVTPEEQTYKPDETLNYEVGLKTSWLQQRLQTDFAFYYIDWTNVQLQSITLSGDSPITVNASDAQSFGLEFQGRFQINDQWAIYGAYAYNESELTKDAPNSVGVRTDPEFSQIADPSLPEFQVLPADAYDGDRLPGTPVNQGSFNVNYTRDMFQDMTVAVDYGFTSTSSVLTKTGLRGRNQQTGTQSMTDTSGEALGGFTLHNLSLTFSKDTWSAMLYTKNMFDKFALTGVRRDSDYLDKRGQPPAPGGQGEGIYSFGEQFTLRQYHHNVIQPRTIGVDFRYNFDIGS
jgi:iron complex outermembrane receptor protein